MSDSWFVVAGIERWSGAPPPAAQETAPFCDGLTTPLA
jgi:hypothetical protein